MKRIFLVLIVLLSASNIALSSKNEIKVVGKFFTLNGNPFDMWGVRVASASITESATNEFIAQLDNYKVYGINSFSVFFKAQAALPSIRSMQKEQL